MEAQFALRAFIGTVPISLLRTFKSTLIFYGLLSIQIFYLNIFLPWNLISSGSREIKIFVSTFVLSGLIHFRRVLVRSQKITPNERRSFMYDLILISL